MESVAWWDTMPYMKWGSIWEVSIRSLHYCVGVGGSLLSVSDSSARPPPMFIRNALSASSFGLKQYILCRGEQSNYSRAKHKSPAYITQKRVCGTVIGDGCDVVSRALDKIHHQPRVLKNPLKKSLRKQCAVTGPFSFKKRFSTLLFGYLAFWCSWKGFLLLYVVNKCWPWRQELGTSLHMERQSEREAMDE